MAQSTDPGQERPFPEISPSGQHWSFFDFAVDDFEHLIDGDDFGPDDIRHNADSVLTTYDQSPADTFSTPNYSISFVGTTPSDSSSPEGLTYPNVDLFNYASPGALCSPLIGGDEPLLAPPSSRFEFYPMTEGADSDSIGDLRENLRFLAFVPRTNAETPDVGVDTLWGTSNAAQVQLRHPVPRGEATVMSAAGSSPAKRFKLTSGEARAVPGQAVPPRASPPLQPAVPRATVLTGGSRAARSKLRSASGPFKNAARPSAGTAKERKERNMHNLVEKQYRNRLNAEYEGLMNALPAEMQLSARAAGLDDPESTSRQEEKTMSKGEVLDKSIRYIQALERDNARLREEKGMLSRNVERFCSMLAGNVGRPGG